jgi:hypothetical protein
MTNYLPIEILESIALESLPRATLNFIDPKGRGKCTHFREPIFSITRFLRIACDECALNAFTTLDATARAFVSDSGICKNFSDANFLVGKHLSNMDQLGESSE